MRSYPSFAPKPSPPLLPLFLIVSSLLLSVTSAQPRYARDPRCPPNVSVDPVGVDRPCSSCGYLTVYLPLNSTVQDCAYTCCGDWSCQSFAFTPAPPPSPPPRNSSSPLTGQWTNYDSLRGPSGVQMSEYVDTGVITATSMWVAARMSLVFLHCSKIIVLY